MRVPGLFYADNVALLSPSAQGLQQLLDTMQSFCVTNGLTISVLKTEVVVFGGGHQRCQWHVGGHRLKRSESFIYLGMLFHEDRHIKHAVQHRLARGYAAQGSIFSRYAGLGCANSVQLLVRLQQAILQPCASYACEVWAPASACIGPFRNLLLLSPSAQGLQQLLDTMQSFCVTNGLTISVLKTEVVVFGGGHQRCQWHVGGHRLKRSESFIYLGMLFHEDRHIKHAVQHRLARGYAAQGSIFSRYAGLGCANSVQLLVRLQQAILQPCASYACEVWAPASACIGPFRNLLLLSPSAQGLQQLLDTMQSFCVTNGLTISVLKTEVVVFGGGHQQCQWHVGGHRLKRSESFIYLGMLFHEDRHIKHAVQHRLARGYAAQGSIFSRYAGLGCANSVQLLVRLQQAILQPCASYACEVWAPASACIGPFRNLQQLQRAFLCRACRVKKSVPVDIIFQELQQMRWHDFWWRRVSSFWSALVEADTGSLHSIIFHDAIQLALAGCKFSWAAQVLQCFSALDEPLPLVADAPIAIDIDLLQEPFLRDRLASFDSLPQDPRLAPSAGVKLCTYHRWFGRPQNAACPSYWETPMGNAKLHRILRFRMGSHHLPVEEGCHFNLPRASRVCNLCNTDALGDERHMLLECPALAALRLQFSSRLLPCSGVMRRLLWAKDQHEVCRYIIACLDRMSSH